MLDTSDPNSADESESKGDDKHDVADDAADSDKNSSADEHKIQDTSAKNETGVSTELDSDSEARESSEDPDAAEEKPETALVAGKKPNDDASSRPPVSIPTKQTAAPAAAPVPAAAKLPPGPDLSYPKPKNFAERMMHALESDIASECVWWVGGGTAIALCPKKLRHAPELTEYFKAKDYSGFIRNCNRWGFRRVAHYSVPHGIVTYENSLFQKDQPHLVKHMRMDSDVQDVFARHRQNGETKEAEGKLAEARLHQSCRSGSGRKGRQRVNSDEDRPSSTGGPKASGTAAQGEKKQPALAGLSSQIRAPGGDTTMGKELLLRQILVLTEEYLKHPGTLISSDESFRTSMQLVQTLGKQHEQELNEKGHMPNILRLEASLQQNSPAQLFPGFPAQIAVASQMGGATLPPTAALIFNPALAQSLLARPNPALVAADPSHAFARQIQQAQDFRLLQQERQAALQSGMLDQFMAHRMMSSRQGVGPALPHAGLKGEAPIGAPGTAALNLPAGEEPAGARPPAEANGGRVHDQGGRAEETEDQQQAEPEQSQQQHEDENPRFTTAHELMMRVLGQQKGRRRRQDR